MSEKEDLSELEKMFMNAMQLRQNGDVDSSEKLLQTILRQEPRLNSRFESLKPIEKLPRELRRERFRQQPVEEKFEKIGSMEGMFNNLSIKPKQNKKKKKKKKKKVIYEEEEKELEKEDYNSTLQMLDNFYPKEESEEEDNSAW